MSERIRKWYVEVNNCCVIVDAKTHDEAVRKAVFDFVVVGKVREATEDDLTWTRAMLRG